jgi:alpha-mannosidase
MTNTRANQKYFTLEKIEHHLVEIRAAVHREVYDIPIFKYVEGEAALLCQGAHLPEFDDSSWADFRVGDYWGGYDVQAWFRTRVPVSADLKERKLCLRFLVGPRDGGGSTAETLLYVNGRPIQGIDIWHEEAWLPPEALQQGYIDISLKAWSGVLAVPDRRRFKLAQLIVMDEFAERYYFLASTLLKTIQLMDENDLRYTRLLKLLNQSLLRIDFQLPRSEVFYHSLAEAAEMLAGGLTSMEIPEIKPRITGIGHSHIDLAWLWRLCHTREKAARTFSTVLHLMRQYPEYRYLHSSPQLYKFLKEDYPEIYAQVQRKVRSGEWEVTGGMWVEADINLTGGESLVRQILLGKRFVRQEFGVDMKTLWLPDVFGYSASLPQLIKKSGLKNFVTSKLSWSQVNRFPYDTFYWKGIDGSQVLTHFITTPEANSRIFTYNGSMEPAEVKGIWDNYQQKDLNDELLLLYGWGDGGGGPTKEMLEMARVMKNIPGLPEVQLGKAEPFLERLEKQVAGEDIPVWDGELYLEYHRGTYTSQAFIKRANRQAEVLFHNAEYLSSVADILNGTDRYPSGELRDGWELILLNQFHDILPGSSIRQVYEDARKDYEKIRQIGESTLQQALVSILGEICVQQNSLVVFNPLCWSRDALVELPWDDWKAATGLLEPGVYDLPVQVTEVSGEMHVLILVSQIPAMGYRAYPFILNEQESESNPVTRNHLSGRTQLLVSGKNRLNEVLPMDHIATRTVFEEELGVPPKVVMNVPDEGSVSRNGPLSSGPMDEEPENGRLRNNPVSRSPSSSNRDSQSIPLSTNMIIRPDLMENEYYRLQINACGQISSLWDKSFGREVLAPDVRANVFQAFEDKPLNFDAWDIDIYYQEKMVEVTHLLEAMVEETGPLRGTLRLRWQFRDSIITQRIRMYRHTRRIDFCTEVDWREQQTLLKVSFPVHIRATRATYDIQFGSIERPTHWNTSWDHARFETIAHKWVDLSEGNYGVSLLNDCKYGHDVKNHILRLTLIKSAVDPDKTADQGKHMFTYALLPHAGDWRSGGVIRESYDLNYPVLSHKVDGLRPGSLSEDFSFASVDAENVIIETLKKAEEGDAWVVRVYECMQSRVGAVRLKFGKQLKRAVETNLIEEGDISVVYEKDCLVFPIMPFEIKTFKVWF